MSKKMPLSQGKFTIVDDADYEWLNQWKWSLIVVKVRFFSARRDFYKNGKRKGVAMSRLIMNFPKNKFVDHINGDSLDNRRSNLRIVTRNQNAQNRRKKIKSTTSKYKGVHKRSQYNYWLSFIHVNGKKIPLGKFMSEKKAAIAYNKAALEHHGEYACLNKI